MPRPLSRKSEPWSARKVQELFDEQFEKDRGQGREDGEVGLVGLPAWINALADRLIEETDHPEWDGTKEDRLKLSWLAMAAVLGEMERFARREGDISVAGARDLGATWDEVAAATGYSSGVSASRRYTAGQRERAAQIQRLRRKRAKEAEEVVEGENDS
jgi:hypothetical protein